jgi:hypothetical protein
MRLLLTLLCLVILSAQQQIPPPDLPAKEETDRKLPNGKSQTEAILKDEYNRALKDAAQLVELSQSLQKELESNDSHVLAISSLKKAEEIEKIAKRIHRRLRR